MAILGLVYRSGCEYVDSIDFRGVGVVGGGCADCLRGLHVYVWHLPHPRATGRR